MTSSSSASPLPFLRRHSFLGGFWSTSLLFFVLVLWPIMMILQTSFTWWSVPFGFSTVYVFQRLTHNRNNNNSNNNNNHHHHPSISNYYDPDDWDFEMQPLELSGQPPPSSYAPFGSLVALVYHSTRRMRGIVSNNNNNSNNNNPHLRPLYRHSDSLRSDDHSRSSHSIPAIANE